MSSSTPKQPKGKFINAFQSIQMINDYVEPEPPKSVAPLRVFEPPPSHSEPPLFPQNNAPTLPLPPPAPPFNPPLMLPPFPMPPVPPPFPGGPPNQPIFPPHLAEAVSSLSTNVPPISNNLQDEIAKFVSETNSIGDLQNKGNGDDDQSETGKGGDELYNPLEDMDEGSDMEMSQNDDEGSPNKTRHATFNSTRKDPDDLDSSQMPSFEVSKDESSIYPSNTIELPSTFELPNFTVSSPEVSADEDDTTRRSSADEDDTTRRSSGDEDDTCRSSFNTTRETTMNTTGMTSMNTTGVTSKSRRDDSDDSADNVSDDSDDEEARKTSKKKLTEHDIDLAIDLITDRKKDLDRSSFEIDDDQDEDDDDDDDILNEARDMFVEAHVERSNPPRTTEVETITPPPTNKEPLNYTVENQKSASNMYSDALQDISDNELSDKDELMGQDGARKPGVGENDELLGAALAELEAEEKEAEQLKKKLTKVKGAMDKVKKKKKKKDKKKDKKKSKSKDKEKGEKKDKDGTKEEKKKKKKKKDKKKEKKDKDKTGDGTEKDKKEKKKKKKEKKSKEDKQTNEISISSVIKEINKEAKEKEKSKSDSKKSKSSKSKDESTSKGSSKEKKKEDKKKNRDKKDEKRDKADKHGKEEKRDKDKDKDKDRQLNDRSNSTSDRVKDKKDKKDKKKGKENKENKENKDKDKRGKKRSSRNNSIEEDSKKKKKDGDHKKRSKDESKKRRGSKRSSAARDDSPPGGDDHERHRRISHSESRKSGASERDLKSISPPAEVVDYHIGFPGREVRKSASPPVLSMSEFYEIQNKVRQLREEERGKDVDDSTRKIRENLDESRKFRESIEGPHKTKEGSKQRPNDNEPIDNTETLKRLRENLAEIHNFREKMTDSRKMRDTLEERKLRNNLMQETKKLQEAIKQRTGDAMSDSDDIEIVEEDSKMEIKKLDIHKPGKSADSMLGCKQLSESDKKILQDNKQTRSMLRDDYNRELDKYRQQHEEKLKVKRELQKKEKLLNQQPTSAAESEQSQDDNENETENHIPKSPPSPPPPPHKRTRNDSGKSLVSNDQSQTVTYNMLSPSGSSGGEQPCTPENIINEIEQADMFVEEQHHMEEERLEEERLNSNKDTDETGECLEIDLNNRGSGSEEEGSDGGSETERKTGHLSLRQYKQRRKGGAKRQRRKSSSSVDTHETKDTTATTGETSYTPKQSEDAPKEEDDKEMDGEEETHVRECTIHSPFTEQQNQEDLDRLIATPSPTGDADVEENVKTSTEEETTKVEEENSMEADVPTLDNNTIPLLSTEDAVPSQEAERTSPTTSQSEALEDLYNPELASTWKEISDAEAGAADTTSPKLDTSWMENNGAFANNESDADVVPSPIPSPIESMDSPYNPELASPFDMGSPPQDAADAVARSGNDQNIDFRAYKDVVAFNDIMKSKVKQQARKHKQRKKLDEINMNARSGHKKDRKLVDHLIRQSQVEEEMKNVLKQYFKSRDITKEEYKTILKKAVPQVTMSNSPIIPDKIQSLMVKFVRKCKGQRMRDEKQRRRHERELAEQQKELQLQLEANAAMLESIQQPLEQLHALNPNLPLPPI